MSKNKFHGWSIPKKLKPNFLNKTLPSLPLSYNIALYTYSIRPTPPRERIKCLIFDSEMCTLQKVGGKDSKGRRVL